MSPMTHPKMHPVSDGPTCSFGSEDMRGPYGAATHVGSILADRVAAHERLTHMVAEIADIGQRHAAIRLLQTTACRRPQYLARALGPDKFYPLLTQADSLNEVALLFTLNINTTATDAADKENLDILRQRLYLSTDYGGYNLTRQADERYVAHYASLAASLHPYMSLCLNTLLTDMPMTSAWQLSDPIRYTHRQSQRSPRIMQRCMRQM